MHANLFPLGPVRARSVKWLGGAIVGWIALHGLALAVGGLSSPFDRPLFANTGMGEQLLSANVALVEVGLLIGLVWWMTRDRPVPDLLSFMNDERDVRRGTAVLLLYGLLALLGGVVLGTTLGFHPLSFHLAGSVFGAHDHTLVSAQEAWVWAGYNIVAYALIPLWVWLRRTSADAMLLRSHDRRGDLHVILAVLAVEVTMQLTAVSAAVLDLSSSQLLMGVPLTFVLYFAGAGLPTMIFIQSLLVPRYLALTGSTTATVVLGGVTYAVMHFPESWMVLTSGRNVVLSIAFLFLTYFGPGMIKTMLTIRTGNAWVHLWAYHAIAPHVVIDTPLIVRLFGIR